MDATPAYFDAEIVQIITVPAKPCKNPAKMQKTAGTTKEPLNNLEDSHPAGKTPQTTVANSEQCNRIPSGAIRATGSRPEPPAKIKMQKV